MFLIILASNRIFLALGLYLMTKDFFIFYNSERPHQSLGHKTPDVVHRTAMGGGALIVDKYSHMMQLDEPHIPTLSTEEVPQLDIIPQPSQRCCR